MDAELSGDQENDLNVLNKQPPETNNDDKLKNQTPDVKKANENVNNTMELTDCDVTSSEQVFKTSEEPSVKSDGEDEKMETPQPSTTRKPKRIARIASDSEDEVELHVTPHNKSFNDDWNPLNVNESAILKDSNSSATSSTENKDANSENNSGVSNKDGSKKQHKRIAIIDSDSEEEPPNESINNTATDTAPVYAFTEKGELVPENDQEINATNLKSRFAAICDSESEEDEPIRNGYESRNGEDLDSPIISQRRFKYPKKSAKSGTEKEEGDKKMNRKDALQQRQEIYSESQRMLRETRVSLPYHKPKSHSIKEFLQNRPRLSLALPNRSGYTPPSLAIKMSTEQLQIVTKKLEEREKEMEKFYKSESESDSEEVVSEPAKSVETVTNGLESNPKETDNSESVTNTEIVDKEELSPAVNSVDENQLPIMKDTVSHLNPPQFEEVQNSESTPIEETQNPAEAPSKTDEEPHQNRDRNNSPTNTVEKSDELDKSNPVNNSNSSRELIFNLDDAEVLDNSAELRETSIEAELINKYSKQPHSEAEPKLSKLELLRQQLGNSKPCLSGGPDQEIDLETGVTRPTDVAQLMERFRQHTATKRNTHKDRISLDVINFSQGEEHRETVAISTDQDEEQTRVIEKPGVRFKNLRSQLQAQIAQQRSELWQKKVQPANEDGQEDNVDEKSDCGADDLLDDEDEAELTDGDESTEDEEDEEYEVKEKKPRKVKSAFVDEEAEESDAEEDSDEEIETDVRMESQDKTENDDADGVTEPTKRPLRRIVKGFTEDSDEEDSDDQSNFHLTSIKNSRSTVVADRTLSTTDTGEDEETLLPYQPRPDKTPKRIVMTQKSEMDLFSPVVQLTGFQPNGSMSKFMCDSPASVFSLTRDSSVSPVKDKDWGIGTIQKKLFTGSWDTLNSETELFPSNTEELMHLCSGKFPSQTLRKAKANSFSTESINATQATTQELLNICSGDFSAKEPGPSFMNETPAETSDKTEDSLKDKQIPTQIDLNLDTEIKNLDEDGLIMQLLDEEEMERFKKKFDSPVISYSRSQFEEAEEVQGGGKLVSDSSDDEEGEVRVTKGERRKQKKLTFSDDESDSEVENKAENDEEIDLQDNMSNYDDDDDNATDKLIDYDSEENEIELDPDEAPQKRIKPSDFLENEAELSESDWDSADEDEKGLDFLEKEEGDEEVFDDDKIRKDLDKMRIRQVLDQDNREIKILQELLLEDGELHGTGRQRQFRWKNIDYKDDDEQGRDETEAFFDEEESEEQWRKTRYQRETFLKSNQEKCSGLEVLEDSNSQVLRLGQEAIQRSLSMTSAPPEKPKNEGNSTVTSTMMLMNTRGSFLARNDKFLTKLAEFTKVTSSEMGAAKNSKSFVFQTLESDSSSSSDKKRKAQTNDGTPAAIKKLRLSSAVSPAVKSVNSKKLFE